MAVMEKDDAKEDSTVLDSVKEAAAELAAPEETPEPEETPNEPAESAEAEPAPEPPAEVSAPEWWGDNVDAWTGLPSETQALLVERETTAQEAIERERLAPEMRAWLTEVEREAQLAGIKPEQALERFVTAHRQLSSNPVHALGMLGQMYGADLSQFAAAPKSGETQQAEDPEQAFLGRVAQVVQEQLGQYTQAQEQQQLQSALRDVEEWAKETDESGSLKRPHFEELLHLVGPEHDRLMKASPNRNRWDAMDEAYQNVSRVRAQPQDVNALVEERAKAMFEAQMAEAEKAKAAAVSPPSNPSGQSAPSGDEPNSVHDSVRKAAQQLAGGSARI